MADSIDRVFSKAVTTIKTLSTRSGYGSLPRPPIKTRIKLYGLYKQATEGDISEELLNSDWNSIEDETIMKKYHSWSSNLHLSQLEAKRRYIEILIDTMKIYASGTVESRELLNELEDLYVQIKDLHADDNEEDILDNSWKSPELSYNPQFNFPASDAQQIQQLNHTHLNTSGVRNASQSTNNLTDMRSIYNYDRNDSLYSYTLAGLHNNNNNNTVSKDNNNNNNNNSNSEINYSWKNEITSIINKMIKDLNFFKKLERQRQADAITLRKFKFIKGVLRLFGYSLFNVIVILAILRFNKRTRFLTQTIGI